MAKKKKKQENKKLRLVLGVCVLALAYWFVHAGRQTTEAATDDADETPAAEVANMPDDSGTGAAEASPARGRAKGMEIPAYLTDREEEIVQHEGFTLSYNRKHLVPNWVAWVLTAERTRGTEKRADNFQPDETIKKGPIALDSDYRGSGYDRGHMCPAADCKHLRASMNECFLLSNMCPQTHKLNAGDWEELENICRKWAVEYDSIYIVCGPVIRKGETYQTIGANRVTVPRQFYKVVLRWTGEREAQAIGFLMDNDDSSQPLTAHAVTVDSVEALTGINFFSKLPKDVERRAEATYDCAKWRYLSR